MEGGLRSGRHESGWKLYHSAVTEAIVRPRATGDYETYQCLSGF